MLYGFLFDFVCVTLVVCRFTLLGGFGVVGRGLLVMVWDVVYTLISCVDWLFKDGFVLVGVVDGLVYWID